MSSQRRPKKKTGGRVVGSVNLRISVTGSSSPAASKSRCGRDGKIVDRVTVGDEDPPEISRRRTNTVDRRLRLGVGWVSLMRLLGPTSRIPDHPVSGGELDESEQAQTPTRGSGSKGSETMDCPPLSTSPTFGISCRITWCGSRVDSFEICPKTGLPRTPGEWLLELPRGTSWRSCRLVLEVIATGPCLEHPRFQEALKHWRHLFERYIPEGDAGESRAAYHLLGRVTVGWQVRAFAR